MIKERNSGISRGFAFIDFPSVVPIMNILSTYVTYSFVNGINVKCVVQQGAARAMMDRLGDDGLVVDDKKLFFEYRYL